MGYTLDNNIIMIKTPTKVTTLNNDSIDNYQWKEGKICMQDMRKDKYYEVYFSENDDTLLLRPKKPYMCYNFEMLFGFGFNCSYYSDKTIIELKN